MVVLILNKWVGVLFRQLPNFLRVLLMANLQAYKDTGELLFDTNLISYGLVKSGYLTYIESWTRKTLRSSQLDPNDGGNWTKTVATPGTDFADQVYGFTVYNTISPIVFITGSGTLAGTAFSGNAITFYYANAPANTKFYCFDLMADNMAGSTYLKTYDTTGRITFNSLQPPLNVVAAIQAPPYVGAQDAQYPQLHSVAYVGGYYYQQQAAVLRDKPQLTYKVDIPLVSGVEYAAYLPWSRGCKIWDTWSTNLRPCYQYDGVEGCGGYVGGIRFMFGPSAGTPEAYPTVGPGIPMPPPFYQVAIDRYPVALVIKTANLPFPFN